MRHLKVSLILLVIAALVPVAYGGGYKNITPLEAYDMLMKDKNHTFLIDVRTRAEYQFLGHPPRAYNIPLLFLTTNFQIKGEEYGGKIAKKTRYALVPNKDFVKVVESKFKKTDNILLICRSGHRSRRAAELLVKAGFKHVYNIVGGFEGNKFKLKDKKLNKLLKKYSPYYAHRGKMDGWKYYGLPYTYKMDPKYIYPPDLK